MNNILLIGAGQLGSRHLQGLSRIKENANVYIVDPSNESLKKAEIRLNEILDRNINNEYYFYKNMHEIPKEINLAIIATNSDIRKKILFDLLKVKNVKNIILEKVLFQREKDFFEAENLINEKKVNVWVNCARRMYPEFKNLKELLSNKNIREISVTGSNWAMGSNTIHFIDIFAYLIDCEDYVINDCILLEYIFENKRAGFVEFNGKLKGKFINGTEFSIECLSKTNLAIEIKILLKDEVYIINQLEQKIYKQKISDNKWIMEEEDFKVHYQSDLTSIAVSKILYDNDCDLTKFTNSKNLHLPIIREFIHHLNKINKTTNNEICPIT